MSHYYIEDPRVVEVLRRKAKLELVEREEQGHAEESTDHQP